MRSKEVEEAIKRMEGVRDKNVHTFVDELTTVLSYIEELENKLDIQKQNKIKILEEQQNRLKKELELGQVRTKLKI